MIPSITHEPVDSPRFAIGGTCSGSSSSSSSKSPPQIVDISDKIVDISDKIVKECEQKDIAKLKPAKPINHEPVDSQIVGIPASFVETCVGSVLAHLRPARPVGLEPVDSPSETFMETCVGNVLAQLRPAKPKCQKSVDSPLRQARLVRLESVDSLSQTDGIPETFMATCLGNVSTQSSHVRPARSIRPELGDFFSEQRESWIAPQRQRSHSSLFDDPRDTLAQRHLTRDFVAQQLVSNMTSFGISFTEKTCLDVGCRSGENTLAMASEGADVIGIDPDDGEFGTAMIKGMASERLVKASLQEYHAQHPDQQFDIATVFLWNISISEQEDVAAILAKVIKSEGTVIIGYWEKIYNMDSQLNISTLMGKYFGEVTMFHYRRENLNQFMLRCTKSRRDKACV